MKLRVIGGSLKGRPIDVPGKTRPTLALVRRGIFDHLGSRVMDARVLDLFAGTGAMGIEALSRGARQVWFVERSRAALRILRKNLGNLGLLDRARVIPMGVLDLLAGPPPDPFDLVFADPPYAFRGWDRLLTHLEGWVHPHGLVICELSVRTPPSITGPWERVWERTYGETLVRVYRRVPGDL